MQYTVTLQRNAKYHGETETNMVLLISAMLKSMFILLSLRSLQSADVNVHFILWVEFNAIEMDSIKLENYKKQGLEKLEIEILDER